MRSCSSAWSERLTCKLRQEISRSWVRIPPWPPLSSLPLQKWMLAEQAFIDKLACNCAKDYYSSLVFNPNFKYNNSNYFYCIYRACWTIADTAWTITNFRAITPLSWPGWQMQTDMQLGPQTQIQVTNQQVVGPNPTMTSSYSIYIWFQLPKDHEVDGRHYHQHQSTTTISG